MVPGAETRGAGASRVPEEGAGPGAGVRPAQAACVQRVRRRRGSSLGLELGSRWVTTGAVMPPGDFGSAGRRWGRSVSAAALWSWAEPWCPLTVQTSAWVRPDWRLPG